VIPYNKGHPVAPRGRLIKPSTLLSFSSKQINSVFVQVIAAEGEHKASRALKEAADIINESSSALQLRYLQTLNQISAEKNSTIIFPMPIDLLKAFDK